MSKFNELYGYLSDRQTPHLFVIAEILYSLKEGFDLHNQQVQSLNDKMDILIDLTRQQQNPTQEQ